MVFGGNMVTVAVYKEAKGRFELGAEWHLLTLTKVMLDSGILTRRLIKERLDQSWGFL